MSGKEAALVERTQTPPVVSFIGWSGVGKTTLLERLIPQLKAHGVRLALLKQDGHEFDVDRPGKDTWRMTQAGADLVAISNRAHAAVFLNRPTSFQELLGQVQGVDLVLTEGYHELDYPQIEVHRRGFDTLRCLDWGRLTAVVTDEPLPLPEGIPQLGFEELDRLAGLLLERLR